jgi:predicted secreted protein
VLKQQTALSQDPKDGQYQVWQFIAPQGGQQDLQFEYRMASRAYGCPLQVFKLSVVVR